MTLTDLAEIEKALRAALRLVERLRASLPAEDITSIPVRWVARLAEVQRCYGDSWASSRAIAELVELPIGPADVTRELLPIVGQRWTSPTGEPVTLEARTSQHRREWRVVPAKG